MNADTTAEATIDDYLELGLDSYGLDFMREVAPYLSGSERWDVSIPLMNGAGRTLAAKSTRSARTKFVRAGAQFLRHRVRHYKGLSDGVTRARQVMSDIDDAYRGENRPPATVSCGKACSACCHIMVNVSADEARVLARRVLGGLEIDRDLLVEQAAWPQDANDWMSRPWEKNRCVFLGVDGTCRVYDDRPYGCRNHFVVSPPEHCKPLPGGRPRTTHKWINHSAEGVAMAAFTASGGTQNLPRARCEALGLKPKGALSDA